MRRLVRQDGVSGCLGEPAPVAHVEVATERARRDVGAYLSYVHVARGADARASEVQARELGEAAYEGYGGRCVAGPK